MPPPKTLWGQRIRRARHAAGLTQVQLAARIGVPQPVLSAWEVGLRAPRDDNRIRVAAALGIPAAQLFAYEAGPDDQNGEAA
jgi:transcriptional regulator with XRE-family HTH domain